MSMTAANLEDLAHRIDGAVFTPEDADFGASHAGFNLAAMHQPDVVIAPRTAADVAVAVSYAAENELPVRAQATGHAIGTPMLGGMLVNTASMNQVRVDHDQGVVRVGAGVRWEQVIAAAGEHDLAALAGSSPTVGVVGYTLGGGMGPMARTFGFNADRVRRLEMVDASGEIVEIDADTEPELFWALRGGRPSVGVVTQMEFDLLEAPTYFGGGIFYAGADASAVLTTFTQWGPALPESVSTSVALLRLPDIEIVPEPPRGVLSVHLRFVHIGDPVRGAEILAPMRAAASPLVDLIDTYPAAAISSVHQDPVDPVPAREDGCLFRSIDAGLVDSLLSVAGPDVDIPLMAVEIRLMGGALAGPGSVPSAVGGRDAAASLFVVGAYPPPLREAVDAGSAAVLAATRPWSTGGRLINFQGYATAPDQVHAAWDRQTWDRLDRLKHAKDPGNRFTFSYVS